MLNIEGAVERDLADYIRVTFDGPVPVVARALSSHEAVRKVVGECIKEIDLRGINPGDLAYHFRLKISNLHRDYNIHNPLTQSDLDGHLSEIARKTVADALRAKNQSERYAYYWKNSPAGGLELPALDPSARGAELNRSNAFQTSSVRQLHARVQGMSHRRVQNPDRSGQSPPLV